MMLLSITWKDGGIFRIETVRDFCPAGMTGSEMNSDYFTVMIRRQERFLFFEYTALCFVGQVGRRFVEKLVKG